jgi:lipoate-protein ligase A
MAVDEALTESARKSGVPVLRFYQWSKPTLSLGYFQKLQDRNTHSSSRGCPVVRRTTGGGAIVHDRELTYSFVWPTDARRFLGGMHSSDPQVHYQIFHRTLIRVLAGLGIEAHVFAGGSSSRKNSEPFLCFQRRASGDLIVEDHKVGGSAQRRCRGAVLQHGSVLLARSKYAPELPGISDFRNWTVSLATLLAAWSGALGSELHVRLTESRLAGHEQTIVKRIAREKFSASNWTDRRP